MANMQKVNCSDIKLGMRFTMPVFFDDGKNMFLARKHTVKKYHVNALQKWDIPFLLTAGEIMRDEDAENDKEIARMAKRGTMASGDVEDLEEVEELEEFEELEEV
ncbi:MAG: phosphohydrolase [Treponema sp.]|nr:phosphohydrolase [Candidatus Treponema merdequi]